MWQTALLYNHRFRVNLSTFAHCRIYEGVMPPYCGSSSSSRCIIYRSHSKHMERCVSHEEAITSTRFALYSEVTARPPSLFHKVLGRSRDGRKSFSRVRFTLLRKFSAEKSKQTEDFINHTRGGGGQLSLKNARNMHLSDYTEGNDN